MPDPAIARFFNRPGIRPTLLIDQGLRVPGVKIYLDGAPEVGQAIADAINRASAARASQPKQKGSRNG